MSLRAKLYSGFFCMVFLALVIGGIAIYVFNNTASSLNASDKMLSELNDDLLPLNKASGALSEHNISAGFHLNGYALGGSDEDFRQGDVYLAKMREALAEIDGILARTPQASFQFLRQKRDEMASKIEVFDDVSEDLKVINGNLQKTAVAVTDAGTLDEPHSHGGAGSRARLC